MLAVCLMARMLPALLGTVKLSPPMHRGFSVTFKTESRKRYGKVPEAELPTMSPAP